MQFVRSNPNPRTKRGTRSHRALSSAACRAVAALEGRFELEQLEERRLLSNSLELAPARLLGSGIYQGIAKDQFANTGDIASYSVTLATPERLSAVIVPVDASILAQIDIVSSDSATTYASATATSAGSAINVQEVALPAGTYLINATAIEGTGGFKLQADLNAQLDTQAFGTQTNDSPASAQDLSGSTMTLGSGADLLAAVGKTAASSEYYSFHLNAGDFASIAMASQYPGSGHFQPIQSTETANTPTTVAVADVNNDGSPDVIVGGQDDSGNGEVTVLLNDGLGNFNQSDRTDYSVPFPVTHIAVGQFDGDGFSDIYAASSDGLNFRLTFLQSNGDGTFAIGSTRGLAGEPVGMVTGDFGDGQTGLAVAEDTGDRTQIDVFHGDGQGNLVGLDTYHSDVRPSGLAAGDLNEDGALDLAVSVAAPAVGDASSTTTLQLLFNNNFGDDTFADPQLLDFGTFAADVGIGNFGENGLNDIVYLPTDSPDGQAHVQTILNDGNDDLADAQSTGNFRDTTVGQNSWTIGSRLALGDINGDGIPELIATNGDGGGSVITTNNLGDGNFYGSDGFGFGGAIQGVAMGDFTGSGQTGFVVGAPDNNIVFYAQARGNIFMNLRDADGNLVVGGGGQNNVDGSVTQFVAPTSGTYYVEVGGDGGQPFSLAVTRGARFRFDPDQILGVSQDLALSGKATGYLDASTGDVQSYSLGANGGDVITLSTATPSDGPDGNSLDITVNLYDASNNLVASNDNGAADGINALLQYTVPAGAGGSYRVEVQAVAGKGEYVLSATGGHYSAPPLVVTNSGVADGSTQTTFPQFPSFSFNSEILANSASASSILINGKTPANVYVFNSVIFVDATGIFTGDGTYTITLAAGAVTSTTGQLSQPFSVTFLAETDGPRIASSAISEGQAFTTNDSITQVIHFDKGALAESYFGIFGFSYFGPNAVSLVNLTTGKTIPVTDFLRLDGQVDFTSGPNSGGTTITDLTASYGKLPEGLYEFRITQNILDRYFNPLDGEGTGLPSGDGVPGGDFVRHFTVDAPGPVAMPVMVSGAPAGSLLKESSATGAFGTPDDSDSFTFTAAPGQTATIVLIPTGGSPTAKITLKDPAGSVLASGTAISAGKGIILQNVATTTAGTYQIQIDSLGLVGAYTIRVILNGAAQPSLALFPGNSSQAAAFDLTSSFKTLLPGSDLANVVGSVAAGVTDYYSISLTAGQTVSAMLAAQTADGAIGAGAPVTFSLRDSNGNVLAVGAPVGANATLALPDFVAGDAGVYYLSVSGTGAYGLTVARSASLGLTTPDPTAPPQDISRTGVAIGYLLRGPTGGPLRVGELVTTAGQPPDALATELNADGAVVTAVTADQVNTLSALNAFDVMLLGVGVSSTDFANALVEWVYQGHSVVVTGRFFNSASNVLSIVDPVIPNTLIGGGVGSTFGTFATTSVSSPITANLNVGAVGSLFASVVDPGASVLATIGGKPVLISESVGNLGRSVFLGVDFSDVATGGMDQLLTQTLNWAAASGAVQGNYSINTAAGDHLIISTTTPGDNGGAAGNQLDPVVFLYNAQGQLVASSDNGAADNRNAKLTYTVPAGAGGSYRVVVSAAGTTGGEYVLRVQGATVGPTVVSSSVVSTAPASGTVFRLAPSTIDLTFSRPLRADSVSASDLALTNGATSTGVQIINGTTLRFSISVPIVAGQLVNYGYSVPAGAFADLQGNPSAAFTSNFQVDTVGPQVLSTSPQNQASAPFTQIVFQFSKPIDPTTVFFGGQSIKSFTGPNGTQFGNGFSVSGSTLTITFSAQLAPGIYTMVLGPGITDLLGNAMDQNGNGTNGEAGDTYTAVINLSSPNLTPQSLTTAPSALFGDTVNVQWTVKNTGSDPTANNWSDKVYLSPTTTFDPATAVLLGTYARPGGSLAVGDSYSQNQNIALPTPGFYPPGDYHLIVVVDANKTQPEGDETDNALASDTIQLTQPVLPDLTAVQITAPAQANYGTAISISWQDKNVGLSDFNGSVVDAVYLSTSPTSLQSQSFLGTLGFVGSIPVGGTVNRSMTVNLPNRVGNLYLVIVNDSTGLVTERDESNNISGTPITLVPPPMPDLSVTNITLPSTAVSGSDLPVTFTIVNSGNLDFSGSFADGFFITPFNTIDGISYLGQFDFSGSIPAGGQVTVTRQVPIPIDAHGNRWIVVTADQNGSVIESDKSNNQSISAQPVIFQYPPLPDMAPSNVTQSATAFSGRGMTVSWTDTNAGNADFTGTFTDYVYVSSDNAAGGDQLLGTFTFTGTLAAGASVQRTQTIQLPPALSGQNWIVVQSDANGDVFESNETNNTAISPQPVAVTLSPFPDLVVTNLSGPTTVFSDQDTQVSWTVENHGNGSTDSQQWNDTVYLSPSATLDGRSFVLTVVPNASFLNAGETYNASANVHIPLGVFGTYYIIVKADSGDAVLELNGEDNNTAVTGAVNVQLTPPPDIRVASITVGANIFSGQPTTLSYTIINSGPGGTRPSETSMSENIYISTSPTFDANAKYLTTVFHNGGLASGQSYSNSLTVIPPIGISGTYYFIVQADSGNQVFEVGFENNNFSSIATNVLLTPPPDLQTSAVIAPASGQASHNLHVSYTVTNAGSTTTPNSSWTDRLYLSPTPTFDPATAIFLTDKGHFGVLTASGALRSYSSSFDVTIPDGLSGTYYAIVVSDANNEVFELDNNNNAGAAAVATTIVSLPADLQATITSAPASAISGQSLSVSFSVQNTGVGDSAVGSWFDRLVLSTDPVLANGAQVASWTYFHAGVLNPGQTYVVPANQITIPSYITPGTYYLILMTDSSQNVYEGGGAGEQNNLSTPVPLTISRNTASLEVQQVTVPASALAGTPLSVSWTVKNNGDANADSAFWYDNVFLSTASTFNAQQVIYLGSVYHVNGLGTGQQYTGTGTFNVPAGLSGDFYVIVQSDAEGRVTESPDRINGTRSSVTPIAISPNLADLKVTSISAPIDATAGLQALVSWTVTNNGTGTTVSYNNGWYDTLYLSTDAILDPAHAIPIGTYVHTGALAAGGQYTVTTNVQLPNGLSGKYYFIVATDSNNRVYEGPGELNNAAAAPGTQFHLQPPIDLVAGTLTIPANGGAGQNASLTYTVSNNSPQVAFGGWQDALYLSPTPTFDSKTAVFFGQKEHDVTLAGNSSYTDTLTAPLPGLVPATYYVILRTDIKDQIPETDKTNNISASLTGVAIDVPLLDIGVPAASNLGQGQSLFYRVVVAEGQSLVLNLLGTSSTAVNQLYASFGKVPTPADHDFQYSTAVSANQRIIVPSTQAGTYYILVRGASVSDANPVTLTATVPQFSVVDTTYGIGGNGGNLTLQIDGTKFDRTDTATLHLPGGATIPASAYYYINATRFYATFNLIGAQPGNYDVNVANANGGLVTVSGGLHVIKAAAPAPITPIILGPQFISAGRTFDFRVVWSNPAYNDAPAPILDVLSTRAFSDLPNTTYDHTSTEFYGAANDDGPAGILRPGQTVGRSFFTKGGTGFDLVFEVDITAGEPYASTTDPFNWNDLYSDLIPDGMSDAQFQPIFNRIVQENGSTWGGYLQMLSRDANLMVPELGETGDLNNLLNIEVRRVQAELGTSISGRAFSAGFNVDIGGRPIQATNLDTGEKFAELTYRDGSFVFESLTPGHYSIISEGSDKNAAVAVTVAAGQAMTGVQLTIVAGASIAGKVLSQAPGGPLDGAIVVATLADGSVFAAQTGEDGSYVLSGIPAGTYTVTASTDGYARQTIGSVTLSANGAVTENFVLDGGGAIKGVVGTSNGAPIDGSVHADAYLGGDLSAASFFPGQFDAQHFNFADLPPGTYTVIVGQDGYIPATIQHVVIAAGATVDLGAVSLQKGILVTGTVTSSVAASPAGNVLVAAIQNGKDVAFALANASGNFTFTNLDAGSYLFEARPLNGGVSTQAAITVVAGDQVSNISIGIVAGATLAGNVVRAGDSAVLSGVTVTLTDASGSAISVRTDASGHFEFDGLKPGDFKVVAANAVGGAQTIHLAGYSSVVTQQLVVASASGAATLSGHLLTAGSQPVAGASVGLYFAGQLIDWTVTNANGVYQFTIYTPGNYAVDATAANIAFAPVSGITVSGGATVSQDLTAGSSSLQVTLSSGAAAAGATVALLRNTIGTGDLVAEQFSADANGIAHFTGLTNGSYRVLVNGISGFTALQNVTVSGASTATVTLVPAAVLSGIATDAISGQTLANVQLELFSSDRGVDVNLTTDTDGTYEFPGVPAGSYTLIAFADEHLAFQQNVTVAGNATLNIAMNSGAPHITGRVVDGGSPVAGVSVYVIDGSGNLLGGAATDSDGNFTVSTAKGSDLTVIVSPEGYAQVRVLHVNSSAGNVIIGNVAVQLLAASSTPPLAAPAPAGIVGPTAAPAVGPVMGPVGAPALDWPSQNTTPAWYPLTVDGVVNAVQYSQIPLLPAICRASCLAAYAQALRAQRDQEKAILDLQTARDEVSTEQNRALVISALEYVQNLGTIAGLALTFGPLAEAAAAGTAASTFLGGASALGYGLSMVQGVYLIFKQIVDSIGAPSPASQLDALDGATGTFANLRAGLVGFIGIFAQENFAKPTFSPGGITSKIGLMGTIVNIHGIYNTMTFSATKDQLKNVIDTQNSADIAHDLALNSVLRAKRALDAYIACLKNCEKQIQKTHPDFVLQIKYPASEDPNDINGPAGFGPNQFVTATQPLNYLVHFENKPTATGPAQHVHITIPLDANFDPRTFRLGDINIGDQVISVGDDAAFYQGQLDLTATDGVIVDVVAGVDVATHTAFWDFQAIDPATGLAPSSPNVGFLPPDVDGLTGQGSVHYSISPVDTIQSGQTVSATATIVFDNNSPLDTLAWTNTFDAAAPSSAVTALAPLTQTNNFKVTWGGTDDASGSGVAKFNVYVSIDGGDFALWIPSTDATSAVYTGSTGHTYAFYSVALDNAGNEEGAHLQADAQTTIFFTSIAGQLFNDANNNGVQDSTESGLNGWTVYLDPINGTPGSEVSTTTDVLGNYVFAGIAPGSYSVHEALQSGYARTAPGTAIVNVNIADGQAVVGPTYGDVLISSVLLDFSYLVKLAQHYDRAGTFATGDLTGDDHVGFIDLVLVAQHYGSHLPQPAPAPSAAPVPAPANSSSVVAAPVNSPAAAAAPISAPSVEVPVTSVPSAAASLSHSVPSAAPKTTAQVELTPSAGQDTPAPKSTSSNAVINGVTNKRPAIAPAKPPKVSPKRSRNLTSGSGTIEVAPFSAQIVDRKRQPSESGLAKVRVFLDDNDNGVLDSEETKTPADDRGNLIFGKVQVGLHHLVQVPQKRRQNTTPAGGTISVKVNPGVFAAPVKPG